MTARNWIIVTATVATLYAGYVHDLAAMFVGLAWGSLMVLLHAIEVKLNRLLDDRGINVPDYEIAKDR